VSKVKELSSNRTQGLARYIFPRRNLASTTNELQFLIWGSVLCDPVAVLSYEEALQVYEVLGRLKKSKAVVDYSCGVTIGQVWTISTYLWVETN